MAVFSSFPVSPNFFISGIWKNSNGIITHVLLHANEGSVFATGVRVSMGHAISLIETSHSIKTLIWSYGAASWVVGGLVHVVEDVGKKYLRCVVNTSDECQLDSLVRMNGLIAGI